MADCLHRSFIIKLMDISCSYNRELPHWGECFESCGKSHLPRQSTDSTIQLYSKWQL